MTTMTIDTTTNTTDTEYLIARAAELRTQAAEADARGEHQIAAIYIACAESHEASLDARAADACGDEPLAATYRQIATAAALRSAQLVEALG